MSEQHRGRPRLYDRDHVILAAARLFWACGYSGASMRALHAACGLSSSSLYAAFGSKAGLFEEVVRTYAVRYRQIYERAVVEHSVWSVIERIFIESIAEFTQSSEDHPGCLISSAVMSDAPDTIDVKDYILQLQNENEGALHRRLDRAVLDGELKPDTDTKILALVIQSVWHGLSAHSNLGRNSQDLRNAAYVSLELCKSGYAA